MIKLIKITLITLTVMLTGCASTVTTTGKSHDFSTSSMNTKKIVMTVKGGDDITKNKDWEQMRQEWSTQMTEVARNAGINFEFSNSDIESNKDTGTLIAININDYRYVSLGARIAVGIMTGNAWLNVDVDYRDLNTGNLLSSSNYQTKSTAWEGAFSAMTEKQIESVCNVIAKEITSHKAPSTMPETISKADQTKASTQ
jgi:uncharacterized lipoprotein YajG